MFKSILLKASSLLCLLFANSVWAYDYTLPSMSTWSTSYGGNPNGCNAYSNNRACVSNGSYFPNDGVSAGDIVFSYTTSTIYRNFVPTSGFTASSTHYISLDAMVGPRNSQQGNKYETLTIQVQTKNSSGTILSTSNFSQNITNTSMETYVLNIGTLENVAQITIVISGKDGGYWNGNYGAVIGADSVLLTDYDPTQAAAPALTPVYSSGITSAQSTKRTSKLNDTAAHGMEAHIGIDGSYNNVDVRQDNAAHYLELTIVGNSNTVDIDQNDANGTATHFADVIVDGNSNTLDLLQTGSGSKTAFIGIDGNSNTVDVIQRDSGQHYLQLDLIGDGHNANVIQEGAGNHEATVELTNGGGSWDFDLTQSGSTSKEYSLPHNMSDGSTTSGTCYVAAGCSLTVIQGD